MPSGEVSRTARPPPRNALGEGDFERLDPFLCHCPLVDETGRPLRILLQCRYLVRKAAVGKFDLRGGIPQVPLEPVPAFGQNLCVRDSATLADVNLVGHPPGSGLFVAEHRRVAESRIPVGVAVDRLSDTLRAAEPAHDIVKPVESLVVEQQCGSHAVELSEDAGWKSQFICRICRSFSRASVKSGSSFTTFSKTSMALVNRPRSK